MPFPDILSAILRRRGIFLLTPHCTSVGNKAEQIYYGYLKCRRESLKIALVNPFDIPFKFRYPVFNRAILGLTTGSVPAVGGFTRLVLAALVSLYSWPCRIIAVMSQKFLKNYKGRFAEPIPTIGWNDLWQKSEWKSFDWENVTRMRWEECAEQRFDFLLPEREERRCRERMAALGIDRKYVCLHIRSPGYYNDAGEVHRNARVENCLPAIEALIAQGYQIVRMGDASMPPLPAMLGLIDYPFTPQKSEALDLLLVRDCLFFIGMQSGLYDFALLFQKPTLLLHMHSWLFGYVLRENDLGLLRNVFSKKQGRYLSAQEILLPDLSFHNIFSSNSDYMFEENSPAEIQSAVLEMTARLDRPQAPSALQTRFNELRRQEGRRLVEEMGACADDWLGAHQQYRFASRLDYAKGRICDFYLQNNWRDNCLNAGS